MKYLNKIIVLFLLMICLVSVSAISAVDLDDDAVVGENGSDNLSVTLSESDSLSLDDENDSNLDNNASDGVYYVDSWDGLKNRIKNANDGDIVYITKSISGVKDREGFASLERIKITKSVTFIGVGSNIVLTAESGYRHMLIDAEGKTVKFENLTFTGGSASYAIVLAGGSVRIDDGTVYFNNCIFKDNKDKVEDGGAIALAESSGNLYITNCIFENCLTTEATWPYYAEGGAIAVYKKNGGYAGYCKNSTFINCNAELGGAIYIDTCRYEIEDCYFYNCKASYKEEGFVHGNAIEYSGSGDTQTIKNCQFIGMDESTTTKYGIVYIFNTGDAPTINFESCIFFNKNNVGVKSAHEDKTTTVNFINCWVGDTTNNTGEIPSQWSDNLKVEGKVTSTIQNTLQLNVTIPSNITYKQNITLKYSFVGSQDHKNYTLNIRNMIAVLSSRTGKLNTTSVSNVGKGFNVAYISDGQGINTITCKIEFDYNYYSYTLTRSFNVDQATPNLIVTVEDAVYGTNPMVYIDLISNTVEKLNCTLNLTISGNGYKKEYITFVTNGKGYIRTDILNVGDKEYTVSIKWDGDKNYKSVSNTTTFKISRANATMILDVDSSVYGTNTSIAIYLKGVNGELLNGTVDVTINKNTYKVTVKNGYGTAKTGLLAVNSYDATAVFAGNTNYFGTNDKVTFNVSQASPVLIVSINNVTYGTQGSIVVFLRGANSVGLTENVIITINKKNYTISVKNGVGYGKTDILPANESGYKVTSFWKGNGNYTNITTNSILFVNKASSNLFIIVNDVHYGTHPLIEARLIGVNEEQINGTITVTVDNKDYLVKIINGKGSNTTDILAAKNGYVASAKWDGNDNYTNTSYKVSFNVFKVDSHLSVSVNDVYYGDNATIRVKLTGLDEAGLTAVVPVTVNGKEYLIDVKEGVGVNKTIILPAKDGVYDVTANLAETTNYTGTSAKCSFKVSKVDPNLFLIINSVYYGNVAMIEVRLNGVNGEVMNDTLTVNVDGENYTVKVVNGVGTNKTKLFAADNYSASVTWAGNTNYTSATRNIEFSVLPVTPTMRVSVDDIEYATSATINVELWGVDYIPLTANVIATVNEKDYLINVVNGVGSTQTERLPSGDYEVTVKLNATGNYSAATVTTSFKVSKLIPSLDIDVTDVIYGTQPTVNIKLFNDKGEGLTDVVEVTVNNKIYQVNVSNGLGSCKIEVLNVGQSYEAIAKLNESENYTAAIARTTFKVNKAQPTLIVEVDDCYYGEYSRVALHLTGVNGTPMDGQVYFTVFNQTKLVNVYRGFAIFNFKFDAGTYYAFVSYYGNENYDSSFNYTTFNVMGSNATLIVDANEVTYGEKTLIEVTLTGLYGIGLDGIVWAFVNNETYSIPVKNGYGFTEINLPGGEYYLTAYWNSREDYNPVVNITSFVVNPANPNLVVSVENVAFNENATVNIQLTGINGEKLNGVVEVVIDGKTYYVNVTNGVGSIKIDSLAVGKYDVIATWEGNNNYTETSFKTSFNVTKVVPTIVIEIGDVYVDEIINITVKTNAVGSMIISVDGKKYYTDIVNGIAFVSATGLKLGSYEVIASYAGNENFTASSNTTILKVKKVSDYSMIVYAKLIEGSEGGNVFVILPSDATGDVIVYINGTKYSGKIIEGKAVIFVSDLKTGVYNVIVNYAGDKKYESLINETIIVVNKLSDYDVNVTGDLNIGEEGGKIIVDFPDDATGDVVVYVDGEKYIGEIDDGKVVINVPDLKPGDHDIIIDYSGDEKYEGYKNETIINVTKVKEYDFDIYSYLEGNTGVILIFLPHDATGYVEVNGIDYKADVVNGTATVRIPDMAPGSYVFNIVYFGDSKYEPISDNRTITFEYTYYLYVQNLTKYYGNDDQLFVVLIDSYGKGIANQTIVITINGRSYSRVSDEHGLVTMNVNLQPGTYTVDVSFNDTYTGTGVVEILSTIEGKDLVKIYKNASQYSAKFLDNHGNPLVNTNVIFNINGVFYVRSTDENGIAILNINLLPGTYIITAQNSNGQLSSNNITVLSTINGHDVVKMYNNGTHYYAQILDEQGNPLSGATIEFNIHGIFYTVVSDSEGIVKLAINLLPGDYILTAYNPLNGEYKGNIIKVLPILEAEDLTKKVNEKASWNVTAYNELGEVAVGVNITFNINGVLYNRTTDNNGVAHLNINLNPGEYIATAYYNDFAISKIITVLEA